ncbi:unnamed protein product, partial [Coregonus sp. 'balchen']
IVIIYTNLSAEWASSTVQPTPLSTSTGQKPQFRNLINNETRTIMTALIIITNLTSEIKAVLTTPAQYVSPGLYHVENPHEYHFILDEPEKCLEQNPFLVLIMPVAPYNRVALDIACSTWGSARQVLGKEVGLFFLLRMHNGEGTGQLQEKSDIKNCYKNLTIKAMVMLEWLSSRCPNTSCAMKIDAVVFLEVHNLINMLLNTSKLNYMTGQLVEVSRHVQALFLEDVYMGQCMKHLGIPPTDPSTGPSVAFFQEVTGTQNHCFYSILDEQLLDIQRNETTSSSAAAHGKVQVNRKLTFVLRGSDERTGEEVATSQRNLIEKRPMETGNIMGAFLLG